MAPAALSVLYIDDEPGFGRLVQKALARRGYAVTTAQDSAEAMKLLDAGAYEAIGLDHNLAGETGLDVLERLRRRGEFPPVVYVTASADTSVAVAALKAGCFDYVPKTIDNEFVELLSSAIGGAIDKASLIRENARAVREMRIAKERAEVLLGEVNHRVANSLALVASLVRLQAGALADPAAREALAETQARISAIAGIHRRLYTSDDIRFVEIDEYLQGLAGELATSMRAAGHHSAIRLAVAPLKIPTDKAVSIGVIVTELVTNAFKYAYRDAAQGEVRIALGQTAPEMASLAVEDDGVGWDGQGPAKGTGLGTRIVKAMAGNLGATVRYAPAERGTRVVLDFAL